MDLIQQTKDAWKEAEVWNNGRFSELMAIIFIKNQLNEKKAQERIGKAFHYYLSGSQDSWVYIEAAIKEIQTDKKYQL